MSNIYIRLVPIVKLRFLTMPELLCLTLKEEVALSAEQRYCTNGQLIFSLKTDRVSDTVCVYIYNKLKQKLQLSQPQIASYMVWANVIIALFDMC